MAFRCVLAVAASMGLVLATKPHMSGNRVMRNPQFQPFIRTTDLQDKINVNYEAPDLFDSADGNQQQSWDKSMARVDGDIGFDLLQSDVIQYRDNSGLSRRVPASRSRNQQSVQTDHLGSRVQDSEMTYNNPPRSFASINRNGVYYNGGAHSNGNDKYNPASYNSAPVARKYLHRT